MSYVIVIKILIAPDGPAQLCTTYNVARMRRVERRWEKGKGREGEREGEGGERVRERQTDIEWEKERWIDE